MTEVERLKMQCHEWRVQAELRKQQVRFLQDELDGALFRAATFLELEDDGGEVSGTKADNKRIERLEQFLRGATGDLDIVRRNLHQSGTITIPNSVSKLEEIVRHARNVLEE